MGKTNTPSEDEQSSLIKDGEIIKYYTGTTPPAFDEFYPVRLATGRAYYPCEENGTFNGVNASTIALGGNKLKKFPKILFDTNSQVSAL